jgi:hypothetical protein
VRSLYAALRGHKTLFPENFSQAQANRSTRKGKIFMNEMYMSVKVHVL